MLARAATLLALQRQIEAIPPSRWFGRKRQAPVLLDRANANDLQVHAIFPIRLFDFGIKFDGSESDGFADYVGDHRFFAGQVAGFGASEDRAENSDHALAFGGDFLGPLAQ